VSLIARAAWVKRMMTTEAEDDTERRRCGLAIEAEEKFGYRRVSGDLCRVSLAK